MLHYVYVRVFSCRGEDFIMMLGPMKKRLITTGIVSFVIPTVIFLGIFF